jgi:glycosyltransferase involved in cell wall biosynthesis
VLPSRINKDLLDTYSLKNLQIVNLQLVRDNIKDFFDGYAPVRYIPLRFSFIFLRVLKHLKRFREYNFDIIQSEELWPAMHALTMKKLQQGIAILDSPNVETLRLYREYKYGHKSWELVRGINVVEKFLCRRFDQILTTSYFDKSTFGKIHGVSPDRISIIENGVDIRQFKPNKREGQTVRSELGIDEKTPIIIFLGNYDYPPNSDAAYFILKKIYPEVVKRIRNAIFMFTGSHIPLWLKKEESENVMLTGWVKNIAAYINAATVCIAPIRFGSGTRIKILEYMACGKPVISTKIGVEGLEVTNTEHLILEDDPNKFASYIVNLTENETLTKELGERARDLVERRYAWKKVVKKLVSLYKTII